MSLKDTKIAISGAGIGGLTAALCLLRGGARVTVLEQAERISEVGAGLQISPNGVRVFEALGLGEALAKIGLRAEAVSLRDALSGRQVTRLDLKETARPYYFVHRADLIDLLAEAARKAGAKIRLLQLVDEIVPAADDTARPMIRMASGAEMTPDFAIAADGLHSRLRPVLNSKTAPFFTHQVAWRATIPNDINHPPEARVHMGPGCHVVSYPLRGGELVNIVAVQERSEWAAEGWNHSDDPDNLRLAFRGCCGAVAQMLRAVEEVRLWGLFRHPVAGTWHKGHTALLGDAAHPTLPFLAQGAVMAIEDAWVLADSLATEPSDWGLHRYQERREARVRRIVETANGNARKYHLRNPLVRMTAHTGLRTLGALSPDLMTRRFDWLYRHDVTA